MNPTHLQDSTTATLRDGRCVELVDWREVPQASLLELLRASLGESPSRTPDFLRWKHLDSPFGASPGIAALADGRPVGLRLFLRWRWSSRDREVAAVRAVDTATHPGWQRAGLFRLLTEALVRRVEKEGVELVFNTPNAQSRVGYLAMGWQSLGRTPVCARPSWSAFRSAFRRRRRARVAADGFDPPGRPVADLLAETELEDVLGAVQREAGPELHTRVDLRYLEWRYAVVPSRHYRALWYFSGGEGAILVLRAGERRGFLELVLAEALVTPGERGRRALRSLLAEATGHGFVADYAVVSGVGASPLRGALLGAGFLPPLRVGPHLTVRPLNREMGPAVEWSRWRLSLGDLELF